MVSSTISAAKLAANQANAQKSTGPTSDEGKATVAKNALKSGLCSTEIVLPGESLVEFESMKLDYGRQIKPLAGGIERSLFDELLAAAWKLRRAQRLETELLAQSGDLLEQLDDDKLQKKFDSLARHRTRLERSFYRALNELKALQTTRLEHNMIFDIQGPLPGLATGLRRFAKQTQPAHAPAEAPPGDSEIDPAILRHILRTRRRMAEFAAETGEMEAMLAEIRAKQAAKP